MKKKFSILILLLFCTNLLFADNIQFTASANKTQVGTGEVFEVTFSINGNGDGFNPPSFAGFQVVGGPNVSNSISMINGVTTSSAGYSYDLVAAKEGDYIIGPATISVNGKTCSTSPLRIKVVKGQPVRQNNDQAASQGGGDEVVSGKPGNISKSLFLKVVADRTNVYLGQQLALSYRLYTRVGIVGSELESLPDLNGFYSEEIKSNSPNAQWRTEVYKGIKYNVADIKQAILFPEHAGNITIEPVSMTFVVRQQAPSSGDPFDSFFGSYEDVKYKIKSQPLVIHVKPLPQAGKPDGFGGAVGNFTIAASLDKNDVNTNDAINYQFKVSGSGSLKLLKPVTPDFPADFEKYDPKITDNITENMNGVSGSRTYNYLLIPRHGGSFNIEPVKFSFFNPATGRYVTLTSKGFPVKVTKGAAENNVTAYAGGNKQDVKQLDKDIRYIKTDDAEISDASGTFYGSGLYYTLLFLGPVLFAGAVIYGKWNDNNNSDIVKVKSRKAGKVAAKHLASAQQQLVTNDKKAFYENLFRGLYGYLSDKLNIPYADLNREKIAAELRARSLGENLTNEMLSTIDLCEMARYAPVSGITEQQVFDKAKNMINNIENKI